MKIEVFVFLNYHHSIVFRPIRWDDIEEYHAIIDDELPGDLHDTIFQIPKMDVDINDEDSFPSTSNLRQRYVMSFSVENSYLNS